MCVMPVNASIEYGCNATKPIIYQCVIGRMYKGKDIDGIYTTNNERAYRYIFEIRDTLIKPFYYICVE